MNVATTNYWQDLSDSFGAAWNRFWFSPGSVVPVAGLRIPTGLAAGYLVASYSADLTTWFGSRGLLPVATVTSLTTDASAPTAEATFHWSYLNYLTSSAELWTAHILALIVIGLFTAGLWSRITSIASLIIVLSYIHRAPMITGQFEPIVSLLLAYLCLAPTGACWSVDAWLKSRKLADNSPAGANGSEPARSILANISLRLIQLHIAGLYLIMGLSKLSGTVGAEYFATWWRGEAVWWLITRSESRLIDLTFLHGTVGTYFVNAWTHLLVAFELAFAILIWKPLARPLLLILSVVCWLSIGLVTGLLSFSFVMLVANLAFLPESTWQRIAKH